MSQQGLLQASVRAVTGTTYTWEGDWHALFDLDGIAAGPFNGRLLQWINGFLGTSYDNLPGAQAALALEAGASNWGSIGTIDLSGGGGIPSGGADIIAAETSGFGVDFLHAVDAKRVAVKVAGTVTEHGLSFFTSSGTSSKWVFDATGTLVNVPVGTLPIDHDPVTLRPKGLLVEPAATNLLLNNAALSTQSVTVAAVAYVLSFWGTGTVTLSGVSTAGPLVGTGANNRVSLTFTPTAGSLTLTVTGTVTRAQLETGSVATSPIPTLGASVTRAVDIFSFPPASINYSATAGSWWAEVYLNDFRTNGRIIGYHSAISPLYTVSATSVQIFEGTGLAKTVASIPGSIRKFASAFAAADRAVTGDGLAVAADAGTVSVLLAPTALYLGNRFDGIAPMHGYIRRAYYVPRRMSNAELVTATAWSPFDLGASLVAWWDADDLASITLEDTTRVIVWTDKIAGLAPDQDSGILARPVYNATAFNGRPCVQFDGINHHLTADSVGTLPVGAAPCEVWALVDQTALPAVTTVRCVFAYGDSSNGGRRLSRNVVTAVNRGRASTGTGGAQVNATDTAIDLSGRHVMRARYDGANTSIEVDAGAATSAAAVPATLTTRTRIGSNDGDPSGLRWEGSIAAILVTGLLTTEQAASLRAYLTARL